jgi:peptide/nickel transport system substrate-binding protein
MLGACGGNGAKPSASGSAPASAAKRGGTLTVVYVGNNQAGLDPGGPTTAPGVPELSAVYDPLFRPKADGTVQPWLATSYSVSPDQKTVTLELRHDVMFQDGTPFDAQAVVFNIQRDASKDQNAECLTYYQNLVSATATGQYEVQVTFSSPDPAFLSLISTQQCAYMASPAAVQKEGKDFGLHPVGTGPFKVTSYQLNSSSFVRWDGYWQKDYPLADQLNFILVGSDSAALAAVQSGQAQIYLTATPLAVTEAKSISGLKVVQYQGTQTGYEVILQMGHPPLDNLMARQALSYATDRTQIMNTVGHGLYLPYQGSIGQQSWAYPGPIANAPTYDLAKAKDLVSKLGGLSLHLMTYNDPTNEQIAQLLKDQWEKAGMQVTIDAFTTVDAISRYHSRNYEAAISGLGGGPVPPNDPDMMLWRWLYSKSPLNQVSISDPVIDQDLTSADASFDINQRKGWYQKLEQQIDQDLPWFGLFTQPSWAIERNGVQGFTPMSDYQNYYQTPAP